MKAIIIFLALVCINAITLGDEITVELDRLALLVPDQNEYQTHSSRIALHFDIPDSIEDKHIVYAELVVDLDLSDLNIDGVRTIEFRAFNITSDWTEEGASWRNLSDDMDSTAFITYAFRIDCDSRVFLDVTNFVKGILENDGDNDGIMLIPHKIDRPVFHLARDLANLVENNTSVRVVYR